MKYCILVVEDHEDTRAILRAMLTHNGYEIAEVETAEDMFERLESVNPDLIVLDVRLPGMDGCAALQKLRADGFSKPIFLFSEYFDLHTEALRTCHPDGLFHKSNGPLPLFEAIHKSLPQNRFGDSVAS